MRYPLLPPLGPTALILGLVLLAIHPLLWLVGTWFDPAYDSYGVWVAALTLGLLLWSATSPLRTTVARRSLDGLGLLALTAVVRLLGQWLSLVTCEVESEENRLTALALALDKHLAEFLERDNFSAVWARLLANHPRPAGRLKAFHDWFDGLKTTRLIHHLCASVWPRCHPEKALPPLLAAAGLEPTDDPCEQLTLLRRLQGGEPERSTDGFPARNVCLEG